MEISGHPDHAYTNTMCDRFTPTEFTYKMSNEDIEKFVKLRVSNSYLFSGEKYSSIWAWRTILKHMGLHRKLTHRQASKKWENLKKRYRELKNPPEGFKAMPHSWSLFSLMDDAMEGRLQGSAPILTALPRSTNKNDFLLAPTSKRKRLSNTEVSPAVYRTTGTAEIEVLLNGDDDTDAGSPLKENEEVNDFMQELDFRTDSESVECKTEQVLLQRQKADRGSTTLDCEFALLEKERSAMERERRVLERERAVMERERAVMERERAVMEREKLALDRDRDALHNERLALEKAKARWERLFAQRNGEVTENDSKPMTSDAENRKERFLFALEKLAEII